MSCCSKQLKNVNGWLNLIKVISHSCHSLMQVGEGFALCSHSQTQTSSTLRLAFFQVQEVLFIQLTHGEENGSCMIMHGSLVWPGWRRSISHSVVHTSRAPAEVPTNTSIKHLTFVKKSPEETSSAVKISQVKPRHRGTEISCPRYALKESLQLRKF